MSDIKTMFREATRLHTTGQRREAEQAYRAVLDIENSHATSWHALGILALESDQPDVAVTMLKKAIAADGTVARSHFNLAVAWQKLGRKDEAAAAYRQALALKPAMNEAHVNLAGILVEQGNFEGAIACYEQALAHDPERGTIHAALGDALRNAGRLEDAITHYRRAAALKPNFDIFRNLAETLQERGYAYEALAACEQAIAIKPDFHGAYTLKGQILFQLAQPEDAAAACRQALALKPSSLSAYESLLFIVTHAELLTPEEVLALARGFESAVCRPAARPFVGRPIDTRRKLRVGFLSAEVGMHAVSSFLESYLLHYDRTRIELRLYSTGKFRDARAARLMSLPDHAMDLSGMDDDKTRDLIMADDLDILVETTSHTRHGRLPMMAQRCAPIQCTYMGYCSTTGVRAIDYFIGDNEVTPPAAAPHFSERLVQIPDLWLAYTPAQPLPEPESWSGDEEVVLGTFNGFPKISASVLELWSNLLLQIPNARLILKDRLSADLLSRERILAPFAAKGLSLERVQFLPTTRGWEEHMKLYNHVDIALDTFPYSSGTTAFDAVYMGTPLVAMRGRTKAGRMGSSVIKALGRPEWVAEDEEAYVAIVQALAADKQALRRYKATLRAEMMNSPAGDGPRLARALEDAFQKMADTYNTNYPSDPQGNCCI